jgi:tRNA uridine 5-carboxymethylaminomethyl modification enzyme
LYKQGIQEELSKQNNLKIHEGTVEDIIVKDNAIVGVITSTGEEIKCSSVVLTTGTFLGGVVHVGTEQYNAGRMGEASSSKLAETLLKHGFPLSRLRTGTPPRLDKRTIHFDGLEAQHSDAPPSPFSYLANSVPQSNFITCYRTQTTIDTHNIVTSNLKLRYY